jgi:hypothetical protein
MGSTDAGHINPRGQRVVRRVGKSPTLSGQYTYELECTHCGHRYGANGPDIDGAEAGCVRIVKVALPATRFELSDLALDFDAATLFSIGAVSTISARESSGWNLSV